LRESSDEAGPGAGPREPRGEPWESGPAAAETGVSASASGRRRLREAWDGAGPVADTGVSASGRRRLREPWDEIGPAPDRPDGRRRPAEPDPVEPSAGRTRSEAEPGEDPISGTGGRRRRREPDPAPVRDGSQTEPWLFAPDAPPDRSARRTPSAEYLIETGEQDAGWTTALDDYAERREGGRHSGPDDASPPTVRLQTLLSELDPNRPRRRHRR
jgi:hypothetical protein